MPVEKKEGNYTIKEISKLLNVPESTLRYWRDKYEDFIPMVGEGRKRRYKEEAVIVLKRIAELSAEELTAEGIAERLSLEFAREITIAADNRSNAATTTLDLYGIQRSLELLVKTQQSIFHLVNENKELRSELDELKKQGERRDRQLIELMRKIQEVEKENKKPWWKKIFGS